MGWKTPRAGRIAYGVPRRGNSAPVKRNQAGSPWGLPAWITCGDQPLVREDLLVEAFAANPYIGGQVAERAQAVPAKVPVHLGHTVAEVDLHGR